MIYIISVCREWYGDYNWYDLPGYYTTEEFAQEEITNRILNDNKLIEEAKKSFDLYNELWEKGTYNSIPEEDMKKLGQYNSGELKLEYSIEKFEKIK